MMSLSARLDMLNFASELPVLKSLLDRAHAHLSPTGERRLSVPEFDGTASFDAVSMRIAQAAKERFESFNLTLQERAAGIKIVRRMRDLYHEMTGEDLPERIQQATDFVLSDFRIMLETEFVQIFGDHQKVRDPADQAQQRIADLLGNHFQEDREHSNGFGLIYSETGVIRTVSALEESILAAATLHNSCSEAAKHQ